MQLLEGRPVSARPVPRVSGHTLRSEGQPYKVLVVTDAGTTIPQREHHSKTGRGLCSCGVLSDVLPSNGRRKQWHRDHKSALLQITEADA